MLQEGESLKRITSRTLVLLLILCVDLILLIPICEGGAHIGVKVGDWVKYSYYMKWSEEPEWRTDIEWVKIEVKEIFEFNNSYTISILTHWKNGTESIESITRRFNEIGAPIIFANLNIGDRLEVFTDTFPDLVDVSIIMTRNYFGVDREAVFFSYSRERRTEILYYDRETGFLLEGYSNYWGLEHRLSPIATNLWQQQQTSLDWQSIREFIFIIVVITVAIVSVVLIRHRRLKVVKNEIYRK